MDLWATLCPGMSLVAVKKAQSRLFKFFLPITLLFAVAIGKTLVTLIFAGQISRAHLNGVGLANTIFNIVVLSMVEGYCSVFDTYAPQVFGSKKRKDLGTLTLKCAAQGALIYLFLLGPYLNLVYVIEVLPEETGGHEDGASFKDIAILYLRLTCPVGFIKFLVKISAKFLAVQGQTKYVYLLAAVDLVIHIVLNYGLVAVQGMETEGLALATLGSNIATLLLSFVVCWVLIRRGKLIWGGCSWGVLTDWGPMLKLGMSGVLNVAAELGMWEVSTFMSQFDGPTALSTMLIQVQLVNMTYATAVGVSYSSSVLTGRALGAGKEKTVKLYMKLTVINTLLESLTLSLVLFLSREYLVTLFTDDEGVVEMFVNTMYLVCLFIPLDHMQANLARGILVTFGKQRFIAISVSVFCYLVALPVVVSTVLLTDLRIPGIYLGFFAFTVCNCSAIVWRIWKLNLREEIEKTRERVGLCEPEKASSSSSSSFSSSDEDNSLEKQDLIMYSSCEFNNEQSTSSSAESTSPQSDNEMDVVVMRSSRRDGKKVLWLLFGATVMCIVLALVSFIGDVC